jgi:trehalose 6-phosphate synthase
MVPNPAHGGGALADFSGVRLSLRFVVPLLIALAVFAWALAPFVDRMMHGWFERDVDTRSALIANSAQESLADLLRGGSPARVTQYFTRLTQDERLFAVGYCAASESRILATASMPAGIDCANISRFSEASARRFTSPQGELRVTPVPLRSDSAIIGTLIVVHDLSFAERRSAETRRYLFYLFVTLGFLVSLITVAIAQLSWRGWVQGLRALTRGEWVLRPGSAPDYAPPELRPVAGDIRALIRDIEASHRPRDASESPWTSAALRSVLENELRGQEVIVVSNREPFLHVHADGGVEVRRPASGLVTALEPIMRACSGTWVAHGSGSADREAVDARDRVAVPPEDPAYVLRRVWLTGEQERGYYYGLANEGIWPLCHIAHVRPVFRSSDWEHYREVNRLFAEAVATESRTPDPIVLVQDYHFALLPRMLRERLPRATIITFWHIPWPNPEAFAICPWREELLDGLLGSSILGFHTQFHCNNFVDTVDRLLEARVDRETLNVSFRREVTAVKRYPISLEWPTPAALVAKPVPECRSDVRDRLALPHDHALVVGVDRLDYTKGIEERFNAVERLLELHPGWVGRFSLVQVSAPSRSSIEQYLDYQARVRALAARINSRFVSAAHPPIILRIAHHEPAEVYELYRAADACFVSSLHDGMNLVAKEFVAARDDERGVLVLSRFTGAARELPEALIVNPYDSDECAGALNRALTMEPGEQRDRMRVMRGLLEEFNVYRWAARMLIDAAGMRRGERRRSRAPMTAGV